MTGPVEGRSGCCLSACAQAPLVSGSRVPARYGPRPMKTRTLVVLALLCGLALLVAFTVQVLQAR
jgi:hypothetical protein